MPTGSLFGEIIELRKTIRYCRFNYFEGTTQEALFNVANNFVY